MGTLPPAIQALTGVDLTGVRIDSFQCFLFKVKIEANIYMRLADQISRQSLSLADFPPSLTMELALVTQTKKLDLKQLLAVNQSRQGMSWPGLQYLSHPRPHHIQPMQHHYQWGHCTCTEIATARQQCGKSWALWELEGIIVFVRLESRGEIFTGTNPIATLF